MAAVLSDVTKKLAPAKVKWTQQYQRAFQALKNSLTSKSVLAMPDYSHMFILQTDATDRGVGAVVSQKMQTIMINLLCIIPGNC